MWRACFILFFVWVTNPAHAQYLVIGNSPGNEPVFFTPAILTGYFNNGGVCQKDLDANGTTDVEFSLSTFGNGSGGYTRLTVNTFNYYSVMADTGLVDSGQYYDYNLLQIVTTAHTDKVVHKYLENDTLFTSDFSDIINTYIVRKESSYWPLIMTFHDVTHLIGDTFYIGFKKTTPALTSLYCMKVFVQNEYTIHLLDVTTNDPDAPHYPHEIIFPNPATTEITVLGNYTNYQIINYDGRITATGTLQGVMHTISVSELSPATYFIRLTGTNENTTLRFVKF
jgi:hypothetical protein